MTRIDNEKVGDSRDSPGFDRQDAVVWSLEKRGEERQLTARAHDHTGFVAWSRQKFGKGRNPESWERETGLAWLNLHGETGLERWTAYVHVLVTSNAFHYRD